MGEFGGVVKNGGWSKLGVGLEYCLGFYKLVFVVGSVIGCGYEG